ncbi:MULTISPECIES: nitrogenase-stabilizing/protective protein NifW [Anaeromyxobacter]|uniref:nitrogenase-stabilizing/protective protein NifW n=1 Tax=Anaeromyxobacter TaxID=161492 RepID=UPI001F59FCE0|nr:MULTISPECIES: nitrogenase-stabilizing/protective protein NifW [unclassified Anaeromyxobacter]
MSPREKEGAPGAALPALPALPELEGLESAEDFFAALGVPFDSRVLAVSRLHLMRRFGLAMQAFLLERPAASEGERRAALRAALREAHALFARSTPLESGDFGVLRGARPVKLGRRE